LGLQGRPAAKQITREEEVSRVLSTFKRDTRSVPVVQEFDGYEAKFPNTQNEVVSKRGHHSSKATEKTPTDQGI
jgi:hypothetical protein